MRERGRRHAAGLTIIELMIGIALVVIVVSLAGPAFTRMIEMQRLRGIHDQIVTDLQFARSEATRQGVPVHMRVQAQGAGAASCYVIFSDTNRNFSPACDCQALDAEGKATCPNPGALNEVKQIKTVVMVPQHKVQLQSIGTDRVGFDPITGGVMIAIGDVAPANVPVFRVESFLDAPRKLQTRVDFTGRPTTCAPAGSAINLPPC